MKVNIFKIPKHSLPDLLSKFAEPNVKLLMKMSRIIEEWNCEFYLSVDPTVLEITWADDFIQFLDGDKIENKIHYAVFLCMKQNDVFAITYGKAHFYVRNYCDNEFGLDIAKRIANERDVIQTATKRFAGKKKKEIKSYQKNTSLDNESGESVDFICSSIIDSKKKVFGNRAKFGSSFLVSRKNLNVNNLHNLLDEIVNTLKEKELFKIPKIIEIKNPNKIKEFDLELIEKIISEKDEVATTSESHELVGVDFVFSNTEKYVFNYRRKESLEYDEITISNLTSFIKSENIPKEGILNISVKIIRDDQKKYTRKLKSLIDYAADSDRIILYNGKWMEFNEEYVDQINTYVDTIEIEPTEDCFQVIVENESEFYKKNILQKLGYEIADKNFAIIKIKGKYKVEAWDLRKKEIVYALKFGSTQNLIYVCYQAFNTLEIIRNKANLKKITNPPKKYCLWLGITNKTIPEPVSSLNSIILKQQIDLFGRKCREIGIEPIIKLSKKVQDGTN